MSATKTILLVDDDEDLRGALKEQFELYDTFSIIEAANAADGISAAKTGRVDVHVGNVFLFPEAVQQGQHLLRAAKGEGRNQNASVPVDDGLYGPGKLMFLPLACAFFGTGACAQRGFHDQHIHRMFGIDGSGDDFLVVRGCVSGVKDRSLETFNPDAGCAQDVSRIVKPGREFRCPFVQVEDGEGPVGFHPLEHM